MTATLSVGKIELGPGKPKIIVPITSKNLDGLLAEVANLVGSGADIVEFRADHFVDHLDATKLVEATRQVAEAAGDIVTLFTIRTAAEGGVSDLDADTYVALLTAVAQAGDAPLIDVEFMHPKAAEVIEAVHAAGAFVVGSNHDFHATPAASEVEARLATMEQMGCDVCKIAVMPNSPSDVAALLSATASRQAKSTKPLLTMSMGPLGGVTRLVGEVFGSVATFATVGAASAPGQMSITDVNTALTIIDASQPLS